MKKILTFILIFLFIFALTGCASKKNTLDNEQTIANFHIIKELYPAGYHRYAVRLCYDPKTKVMYYMTGGREYAAFSVSPYYLSNGELGIYGKNYK